MLAICALGAYLALVLAEQFLISHGYIRGRAYR
jgi:hypothetical protein